MSPVREVAYPSGPYIGMRDILDPSAADERLALLLQNVYPLDPERRAGVGGRPGYQLAGAQLGGAGARRVQGIHQFTKLDGTEYTVAFVGGKMYTFNWSTRVWSEVTLSGVSLSSAADQVYAVTFANKMVVSDGVNRPWTWDGSAFVDLTNAPVMFGPPTVYYAKLFGIKDAERNALVWSEENDPATGYEAGVFNNAWTLGQTDQEALYRLVGTNTALYYFRARSCGAIYGAVTPEFQTTGTHEGVSPEFGSISPGAFVVSDPERSAGEIIFFLDAEGGPHVLLTGGGLRPVYADIPETLRNVPRSSLSKAVATHYPGAHQVALAVAESGSTEPNLQIAVDEETHLVGGLWRGPTMTALGQVKDDNGVVRVMHGTANGYLYDHGNPDESLWEDQNHADDGGTLPIEHKIYGTPLGYSLDIEKVWDKAEVSVVLLTDLEAEIEYETPRGLSSPQTVTATGSGARWDEDNWDEVNWVGSASERRLGVGLEGYGRWLVPRLRHSKGTERLQFVRWNLTGFPERVVAGTP